MTKLILKYFAVISIATLWYAFIVYEDMSYAVIDNKHNYLAAVIDKIQLLQKSGPNKILLLGGSNLAFGVDSYKIHSVTNKEVVNMGLHGGLGLNLLFELSDRYIYRGDIVICSPEYNLFKGNNFYGDSNLIDAVYYIPEYSKLLLSVPQLYSIVEKNLYRNARIRKMGFKGLLIKPALAEDVYYREAFNGYGDVVSHLDKPNRAYEMPPKMMGWNTSFVHKLIEFKKAVENKGATFIFAYPCITETRYNNDANIINCIHKSLLDHKIVYDLSPKDLVFADKYFFNTSYHLNVDGRDTRTQLLIDLIQKGRK